MPPGLLGYGGTTRLRCPLESAAPAGMWRHGILSWTPIAAAAAADDDDDMTP